MRNLIVQELVTVDGFVAGRDGGLDFFDTVADYGEVDQDNLRLLADVDTVLLGAATYRLFVDYWPTAKDEPVAHVVNTVPKIVFSTGLTHAPWGEWPEARVVHGNPVDEVTALKQQPGKDILVWGSLTLARSLLAARLVDELQLRVCPVAIGTGRTLFPTDGDLHLELVEATAYRSGILATRYRPRRA
ncbi:Dihydrofolate reductase [Amycolatopsis arida]|uniref:Dihydrofolate reductase n=1 Tax=Amycolatopsis arida TaxID=587909 RepID=A0A1I5TKA1_9PSEU|nr:dihydrofolate reductase family protein [Amycolatopsis arida]TDX96064.1 dihydrofolate reductase [Amycolatopsis arida]SFP83465.1 Dihydrofolate reductase [Amycolatopsis arida]